MFTKASLLAGVGFPSGMYLGQSSGTSSDLSHLRFLAEVNPSHDALPLGGFKPSLVHVFWRGRGGSLLWREDRVMDITRVQAPNLVLSHRVDASSPGSCVTWQDAANFMTTFWSIWHVTVPSHTNAKHDNVVAVVVETQGLVWTARMWLIGCHWFENRFWKSSYIHAEKTFCLKELSLEDSWARFQTLGTRFLAPGPRGRIHEDASDTVSGRWHQPWHLGYHVIAMFLQLRMILRYLFLIQQLDDDIT